MVIALVIGIFVLVIGFIVFNYLRHRSMSFEGAVTDKDVKEIQVTNTGNNFNNNRGPGISFGNNVGGMNNQIRNEYVIKVQTTAGKSLTWQISEGKYEMVKIGDHVSKQKGTTDIDITPQTPAASPAATPTPPPSEPPASPPIPPTSPVPPTT